MWICEWGPFSRTGMHVTGLLGPLYFFCVSIIACITLNVNNQRAVVLCSIAKVDTTILKSQV